MLVPWRIKKFLSDRFPLAYHVAVNLGTGGNNGEYWDEQLAAGWNDPRARTWPTKNALIQDLTTSAQSILDIACGTGTVLRHLKEAGYQNLHGLEISQYAVTRLAQEGFMMHRGVLPKIPLAESEMDIVIASQILEHVIRRNTFLSEIRRVLKPGGQAMIFVPDNCMGPVSEKEHCAIYTEKSLRRVLRKHFEIQRLESMKDANYELPFLFALVRKPHPHDARGSV